jgi:hypothetical protein
MTFSANDIFRDIDKNNNGFLTSDELAAYFEGEEDA